MFDYVRFEIVRLEDVRFEDLLWRGLLKRQPPALTINTTSSLMLQVEVIKTRLPGILGDNEIHRAASCTMVDPAASHVRMA